jgi:hypothetical protein
MYLSNSGRIAGVTSDTQLICELHKSGNPKFIDDALLIAAAPDLLEVCQSALSALRSYQYGNGATELAKEVADRVQAAIAKAEQS